MATRRRARVGGGKPWQWGSAVFEVRGVIGALLWTLHDLGGEIRSERGFASGDLLQEALKRGYAIPERFRLPSRSGGGSLSQIIAQLDDGRYGGAIVRDVGPKRCYGIKLLLSPEELPERPVVTMHSEPPAEPVEAPEPAQASEPEEVSGAIVPRVEELRATIADPVERLFAIQQLLAEATIDAAIALAQPGESSANAGELDALQTKVAGLLEDNQRLRRKMADTSETLLAKSKECEALRKALTIAQANVRAIQEASRNAPDLERKLANLRGVERVMQERPHARVS